MNQPNQIKQSPDIPDQNVLDLRQIMAARQAAQDRRRPAWRGGRSRTKLSEPRRSRPHDHRPPAQSVAWPKVKKETIKFVGFVVFGVLPLILAVSVWRMNQEIKLVITIARSSFVSLESGATSLGAFDIPASRSEFKSAESGLRSAEEKIQQLTGLPAEAISGLPLIGKKYAAAREIITLGRNLAAAGMALAEILPADQAPIPPVTITSKGLIEGSIGVLKPLSAEPEKLKAAVDQLAAAVSILNKLDLTVLPAADRSAVADYQRLSTALLGSPDTAGTIMEFLLALLVPAEPKEYLVIFQNNDELRATGGFAGTFLLIKFDRGTFTILDAPGTGPYDLTARNPRTSQPPQPLLAVAPYWTFHDANWFLDGPTSAGFMLDFYQQARGFRPDGVIMLTPQLVEDLLTIAGPIRPDKYQIDITADNFVRATEQQVEFGYDRALNNPKQFLIDLVPALITRLAELKGADGWRALAAVLRRLTEADAMFFSQDPAMQSLATELGWDGAIRTPADDYLAVVDTNLGGGKTDRVIDARVDLQVQLAGARAIHTVTVSRRHDGQVDDLLTHTTNRNFIRVYAPANSEFIDISGASIPPADMFKEPAAGSALTADLDQAEGRVLLDERRGIRLSRESGLNVFGAWSIIGPGQSQSIKFTYATPLPADRTSTNWSLWWQKQPGAPTRQWSVTVDAGKSAKVTSFLPVSGKLKSKHAVEFKTDSTVSRTFGVVYQP